MSLKANDLRGFVKKVFEIDSYKSKIGNDAETVVVSFTVEQQEPAEDLENFLEMGYPFVLDADVSPGETDDGVYQVFVELERGRHISDQIVEMLDGISKITGIDNFRFRWFKGFKSKEATLENLKEVIPASKNDYEISSERTQLENFSNFFKNSYSDSITVLDESITFRRIWADPLKFNIINSGPKQEVYESIPGPFMLENQHIAETLYLTKQIGNYNITKIGNTFIFENSGWAVALERIK